MKKTLAVLAVLAVAAAAQADLLASWNLTGKTGAEWNEAKPIAANTTGDNIASATLSPVGMTDFGTAGNSLRVNGSSWGGIDPTASSYISVSLTADANYTMTVTNINMRVNRANSAASGQALWVSGGQAITEPWALINSTSQSPALLSNPSGSSVELRLLATMTATGGNYGFTGAGTTGHSLQINGTTAAVPEPTTMSLLGLGALAMVLRRKLRK